MVHPTWSGAPADSVARVAPFLKVGTLFAGNLEAMSYGTSLTLFDPYIVNGQRVFMELCWFPALDTSSIAAFIEAMAAAVSPGCALFYSRVQRRRLARTELPCRRRLGPCG